MKNIVVALSGGVDSSYTAYTLKNLGFNVSGVYMKLHNRENYHDKNIENVKRVADYLGIEADVLDFSDKFNEAVFTPFINTYKSGKTPNPCALCNRYIKLGALLDYAKSKNAMLASGHYAQIENNMLKKALDLSKDQTYFLANVDKQSLNSVIFPLGNKYKKDIKEQALKIPQLKAISEQKESSEICFVSTTYTDILKDYVKVNNPGVVKDVDGKIVGKHDGYMHYTIGKRRGFSVNGAHEAHFVLKIDAEKNELIVGKKQDLEVSEFKLENINSFVDFNDSIECEVKIRYNTTAVKCRLYKDKSVKLEQKVFALAAGQLAVFYQGDFVVASGFIKE